MSTCFSHFNRFSKSGSRILCVLSLGACLEAATVWKGNFGTKTITAAGTYQLGPDANGVQAKGSITVDAPAGTTVIIEGTNGLVRDFYTNGAVSNPGAQIQTKNQAYCTTIVRNLIVRNNGSFGIVLSTGTNNSITNTSVISQDDDYTQDGFGISVNGSGTMTSCVSAVSDDSYKVYGSNSSVSDSIAEQKGNGSCIQYGWGENAKGDNHSADKVTCKSNVIGFSPGSSDTGANPGRSVIGFSHTDGTTTNNIVASNITVSSAANNWSHTINIKASGGSKTTTMSFSGSFAGTPPTVRTSGGQTYSPVIINASGTDTKIDKLTINFGGVFKNSKNLTDGNNLVSIPDKTKVTNRSIQ